MQSQEETTKSQEEPGGTNKRSHEETEGATRNHDKPEGPNKAQEDRRPMRTPGAA
jgi:hypothetical protein